MAGRVSQLIIASINGAASQVRSSQMVISAVASANSKMRVSQVVIETVSGALSLTRASQSTIDVLMFNWFAHASQLVIEILLFNTIAKTPTFNPGQIPYVELTDTPRMISNQFGDGYAQDSPDGLNVWTGKVNLTWSPVPVDTALAIRNFLRAQVGAPFFYTLPREIAPRLWVCTSMTRSYPHPAQDSFVATFEERFTETT
jgi:phage-related protein